MFRDLFDDPDIAVAENDGLAPPPLLDAEKLHVERAVPKRRRQFAAGRGCARQALAALGVQAEGVVIGRCEKRAPIWPDGFVGSITHTEGHCAAAVARVGRVVSVGIDVETRSELEEPIIERICSPAERDALERLAAGGEHGVGEWGKLVFSAKEAFYKAFFPLARVVLGFKDGHLDVDPKRSSFRMTLHDDKPRFAGRREVAGRFVFGPEHVFTAVVVARDAED